MKVVFVLGPTASGKSQKAIEWAEGCEGVILNADSLQFYSDLYIGSAAPSEEDKKRVPHYLFHVLSPPQKATAGWFYREANAQLSTFEQNKIPYVFVVGGSGFYLSILENGLLPIQGESLEVRLELENKLKEGNELSLYNELQQKDPETASKISSHDHYRLVRALEVIYTTGTTLSEAKRKWQNDKTPFPYPLLKVGFDFAKENLRQRVEKRTQLMLQSGLIEEVERLIQRGYQDWMPLQSVGYKETLFYIQGFVQSKDELEKLIVVNTMKLIKKQKTWFKRDQSIQWVEPDSPFNRFNF